MSDIAVFFRIFGTATIAFEGVFLGIAVRRSMKAKRSRGWPSADGKILESAVASEAQGRGHSYAPHILYEYRVGDARYSGTAITVCDSSFGLKWSRKVVDRYPAGASVKIYYDPENPADALLEPRNINGLWALYAFLLFAAAFVVFMMVLAERRSLWRG